MRSDVSIATDRREHSKNILCVREKEKQRIGELRGEYIVLPVTSLQSE